EREHAAIAALVVRIRGASDSGDFPLLKRLLVDLELLEEAHYATEAALMHLAGMEMRDAHRGEHADLIGTLRAINRTLLIENSCSASPQIAAHLEAAMQHMEQTDAQAWD